MSLAAAEAVQQKIEALQEELHAALVKSDEAFDAKRAPILAARDASNIEMIANKELPEDFWAQAVIALLTLRSKENETTPFFMGPYDEKLLKTYLKDVRVVLLGKRQFRLSLTFAENPFFSETELWVEVSRQSGSKAKDGEKHDGDTEEPEAEEEDLAFSGITWKEGHGPVEDEEDSEDGEGERGEKGGHKRAREGESALTSSSTGVTTGPSMLQLFSVMPPHPEDDEAFDDCDDDELADAAEEWEDEVEDRQRLLQLLAEELVASPQAAITALTTVQKAVEELNKKAKPE